jgi:hypothetical protein
MAFAAAVALAVAALREDSRPTVGIIVVATCVACLTCKLAADELASREADGRETSRSTRVRIISVSAAIAVAILGASDLVFLAIYSGYMVTAFILAGVTHFSPHEEPEHIFMGTLLGGIAALGMLPLTRRLMPKPITRAVSARRSSPEPASSGGAPR